MMKPFFSVVMATFGRGRHIMPSIQSVLQQDYEAFELIVIGDNCTDDTETVVESFKDSKVRWINLPARCRSQSAPNNAGIKAANGDIIAYIGHDDIWEPDHLSSLAALFTANPSLDFAVGGLIFHLPNGILGCQVTGIFKDDSAKHKNFFPPSSFAHKKLVCEEIGFWRMPFDIRPPVDCDFLLRAANADLHFASTGNISVHKFAAGHRYLSYLTHESDEQSDMLAAMRQADHARNIARIVEESKNHNVYMTMRYFNYKKMGRGVLARQNASRKGIVQRSVAFPSHGVAIRHKRGHFAFDWQNVPDGNIHWTSRNPNPKMLLPYTGGREVRCTFRAYHDNRHALDALPLLCNGRRVNSRGSNHKRKKNHWSATFCVQFDLNPNAMTILQFLLDETQAPSLDRPGIGIGTITIVPAIESSAPTLDAIKRLSTMLYLIFVDYFQRSNAGRLMRSLRRR
ncbi:MAG: glycosyltransferase [Rhodobacteraceae bacterium]|nr:glycosyltransferase [Paracoccaceae bacterium]